MLTMAPPRVPPRRTGEACSIRSIHDMHRCECEMNIACTKVCAHLHAIRKVATVKLAANKPSRGAVQISCTRSCLFFCQRRHIRGPCTAARIESSRGADQEEYSSTHRERKVPRCIGAVTAANNRIFMSTDTQSDEADASPEDGGEDLVAPVDRAHAEGSLRDRSIASPRSRSRPLREPTTASARSVLASMSTWRNRWKSMCWWRRCSG